LIESVTRKTTTSRKFLNGLTKCVENNLAKEKGERLFKAKHGGLYDVFNQRPIPENIISYCINLWNYVPPARNYFDGSFGLHNNGYDNGYNNKYDDWYDDGSTSCKDIINDCDHDHYYSD
ncbi:hypothetical protein K469DRAFT_699583, partial [Zopfia rhizophila CBS 207.26]